MSDSTIHFSVNGKPFNAAVEPRTSLADLLREQLRLTGTHLGCEQGACGACTVLVDGVPVRSCIGSAMALDGAEILTIEGLDDDPLMQDLRDAFRDNHALQCGFCTPGMLVMARDVVRRLPGADKDRIRIEMSGNLCRCTGYTGIINAIHSVAHAQHGVAAATSGAGPAGAGHAAERAGAFEIDATAANNLVEATPAPSDQVVSRLSVANEAAVEPSIHHDFVLNEPPDKVGRQFQDVPFVVSCIPGANLKTPPRDGAFDVSLKASMGPISAEFEGVAHAAWEAAGMAGTIKGRGRDANSATMARGTMNYTLSPGPEVGSTKVQLHIGYALSGALGQFARGAIVRRFVSLLAGQFAENFEQRMAGGSASSATPRGMELRMGKSLFQLLRLWLGKLLARR